MFGVLADCVFSLSRDCLYNLANAQNNSSLPEFKTNPPERCIKVNNVIYMATPQCKPFPGSHLSQKAVGESKFFPNDLKEKARALGADFSEVYEVIQRAREALDHLCRDTKILVICEMACKPEYYRTSRSGTYLITHTKDIMTRFLLVCDRRRAPQSRGSSLSAYKIQKWSRNVPYQRFSTDMADLRELSQRLVEIYRASLDQRGHFAELLEELKLDDFE